MVCHHEASNLALALGDPNRAVLLIQRASALSGTMRPSRRANIGVLRLAQVQRSLGELCSSHDRLCSAINASRELSDHVGEGYLLLELGELQWASGDLDGAEHTLSQARQILSNAGRPTGEVVAVRRLAHLCLQRGNRAQARRVLQEALDRFAAVHAGHLLGGICQEFETLDLQPTSR